MNVEYFTEKDGEFLTVGMRVNGVTFASRLDPDQHHRAQWVTNRHKFLFDSLCGNPNSPLRTDARYFDLMEAAGIK